MRLKKWTQAWKIRLIQEKAPSVDHCDAQWIPAFAGMTESVLREWQGVFCGNDGKRFAGMTESVLRE